MKEAKISEVKNQLSDRPTGSVPGHEVLADLERKGLIRRGTGRIPRTLLNRNPPGRSAGVLDALLEERSDR